ncbi:MAG: penicillin acylase family protein [Rhodospirillales bacterium]|nr:MAG: penicillin acylase family protein [Rhodospirillales bacterium]
MTTTIWIDPTPAAGAQRVAGLSAPVDIFRDPQGIPHIRAGCAADAWFGQGYAHAQDRLWQMDAARRRAVGRWAEWGGPSGVASDALARRLDVAGASRRDLAAMGAEGRAMLDSYAAGVNAFIVQGRLPIEYTLLGEAPEPWEAWHSIAAMRQRGFLMGSVWFKLWRAAALRAIGPDQLSKLRYDDGGGDLLCIPPGIEAARWIATLSELAPALEAVAALGAVDATGGGSNNWALSPSRTATGRPMLAGDPHRVLEIPNMYTQAHVACDTFDAIGLTVPGVPGFPHFGHNGRVAWCVTHAFMDIYDLYVEKFAPGDPGRYLFKGEWLAASRRIERIAVRGAADIEIEVFATRHGGIIAGDPAAGAAVALRSPQIDETDTSLDCLPRMLRAGTVRELFDSTRGWGLLDHNLVAGDTAGSIGHLVRAIVPDRDRINGWLQVPGWTGAHEWRGMVPFERMPVVIDPPDGRIVTANNRVVADTHPDYLATDCHPPYRAKRIAERLAALGAATVDDMAAIHMDVSTPNGRLLRDKLAALGSAAEAASSAVAGGAAGASAAASSSMSAAGARVAASSSASAVGPRGAAPSSASTADARAVSSAAAARARSAASAPAAASSSSAVPALSPAAEALRARVVAWDARMDAASTGATAYIAVRRALTMILAERAGLAATAADPLMAVAPGVVAVNQLWWTLPTLLRDDDAALLKGWSWAQALAAALERVAGDDTSAPWGAAHRPKLVHPLSSLFADSAALLDPVGLPQQGDGDCVLANGLLCSAGTATAYGPLARYVFDVGAWENSRWIVFHGASGQPGSPHYMDQHAAWTDGRMVPMLYDWRQVEAQATARLTLSPG